MMQILIGLLLVIHVIVCLLLVGAVLMQLPRSEGLGAAFGGGVTENLFGAQTATVLTKATVWLGILFFLLTLLLAIGYSHLEPKGSDLEKELLKGGGATDEKVGVGKVETSDGAGETESKLSEGGAGELEGAGGTRSEDAVTAGQGPVSGEGEEAAGDGMKEKAKESGQEGSQAPGGELKEGEGQGPGVGEKAKAVEEPVGAVGN